MTVSYTAQVSSCKRFGCFWMLLFRWKGSIYKLLWPNLMVYGLLYATLSVTYRFLLGNESKTTFEKLSLHCQIYSDLIPLSFVLGFYVSIVIKRWWDQYLGIPWPDALAVYVSTFIPGQDERARLMRRTIMRYANLSLLLTLRMMCTSVKKRFPTLDHLVDAGFLLRNEKKIFEGLDLKTSHPKYWLPLVWATAIATRARREGKIPDDFALKTIIDEIVRFRGGCGSLLNFDWISIPLVYTQVVTLAVYTYFAATLMGNQYLDPSKGYPNHTIDLVVPIFTLLQFFFYMGWLLVAETLVNPFGEDDDDFEVNWLIDRNLQISYVIVDEMHEEHPELIKDQYWDQIFPIELPYTEASKQYYTEPFLGSAFGVAVPQHMQTFVMMPELGKDDHRETTPVSIKGTSHMVRDSVPSFQFMGSSLSLHKKRWKPFLKNAYSQPYSINSSYRFHGEDYQDDLFNMSGISLSSSRAHRSKFCSEREIYRHNSKKHVYPVSKQEINTADVSSANSPSVKINEVSSTSKACFKEDKLLSLQNKSTTLDYDSSKNTSENKEVEVYMGTSPSTMQIRSSTTEESSDPILPAINEHYKMPLMDLSLIRNATKLEILANYNNFDTEINPIAYYSGTNTIVGTRSEAVEIPSKSKQGLKDISSEENVSGQNHERSNFGTCDLET